MFRTAKYSTILTFAVLSCAQSAFAADRLASKTTPKEALVIVVVAVSVAAVLVGIGLYLDKVRADKIAKVAASLGLTYRRKPTPDDLRLPSGCHLMEIGRGHTVGIVLEAAKTPELAFTLFDFNYTTGSGRSSTTYRQTVSRMESSLLRLPSFILFPETIFSVLGESILGRKDIDFSDSPVFSNAFVLRGDDDAAIRAVFSPQLRKALEATPKLTIEGTGDHLFIFRAGVRLKAEEFAATIEQDKKILALFFEAQQGGTPATS